MRYFSSELNSEKLGIFIDVFLYQIIVKFSALLLQIYFQALREVEKLRREILSKGGDNQLPLEISTFTSYNSFASYSPVSFHIFESGQLGKYVKRRRQYILSGFSFNDILKLAEFSVASAFYQAGLIAIPVRNLRCLVRLDYF